MSALDISTPSSPKEAWLRFSVELYQIVKISQMVTYYVCDERLEWFQEFRALRAE